MSGKPPPNSHPSPGPASPSRSASPEDTAAGTGDVTVVRSEERLCVGTDVRVSGRAVLRKYVVTETVTQTFQVRHEEVRLEHEPATDTETASSTGEMFDGRVLEMTLHREVPVVQMTVVPTERVVLHVDTITKHVTVAADLRKEQFDLDVTNTPS